MEYDPALADAAELPAPPSPDLRGPARWVLGGVLLGAVALGLLLALGGGLIPRGDALGTAAAVLGVAALLWLFFAGGFAEDFRRYSAQASEAAVNATLPASLRAPPEAHAHSVNTTSYAALRDKAGRDHLVMQPAVLQVLTELARLGDKFCPKEVRRIGGLLERLLKTYYQALKGDVPAARSLDVVHDLRVEAVNAVRALALMIPETAQVNPDVDRSDLRIAELAERLHAALLRVTRALSRKAGVDGSSSALYPRPANAALSVFDAVV